MALKLLFNSMLMTFFAYCYYYIGITTIEPEVGRLSDATWPQILLALAVVLLAINLIKIVKEIPKEKRKLGIMKTLNIEGFFRDKLFIGMIIMLVYSFALDYIGFIPSSILLFIVYSRLLGEKSLKKRIIFSLAAVIVFYVIFAFGLGIMMPRGKGIFRTVALLLESL